MLDQLLAQLALGVPWLAVILPLLAGILAIVKLWRSRGTSGEQWTKPLAAAAAVAVLGTGAAWLVIGIGHMWSPSRLGAGEHASMSVGVGVLLALSGLAGYVALRRGGSGAGLGFFLGPIILMAAPLALAPAVQGIAQESINQAYFDAARERGSHLGIGVDNVSATVGADGEIDQVRLHITISSDRSMSLVPSDSEIDWGLLRFRLAPPGGATDGDLYAQCPIGTPRFLQAGIPVDYDLTFASDKGGGRPAGEWILTVDCVGDGELYERSMSVPIAIAD